ncbi:MAG: hypothetical protein KJ607_13390 [Bacteroidetes bacterium]|nr:hypothetical protein [Bacteroidota bacterium]
MKVHLPNMLLIAGTGQNTGKTTLACRLIDKFSKYISITALKTSPHFFDPPDKKDIIVSYEDIRIVRETNRRTGKDSSRMLNAGAFQVYYIMLKNECRLSHLDILLGFLDDNTPVICESGALGDIVIPGLLLLLREKGKAKSEKNAEWERVADQVITFDGNDFDFDIDNIAFRDNSWILLR